MPLLRLDNLSLAYGHHPLLDRASLTLEAGERLCLIGRNGEGKSSLLRIVSGATKADSGQRVVQSGVVIAVLDQEVAENSAGNVFDVVASGLASLGHILAEYHRVTASLSAHPTDEAINQLGKLQHELDTQDGWRLQQRIDTVLSELTLDGSADINTLSGGWRRRVMLARALVSEPDVLLLDEPTNHLDIEAITWLEDYLAEFSGAVLFVSHDRAFLRRLATRIIELDRGVLSSWPGSYDEYLRRKTEQLAAEETQNALFDKKLSQEEVWIRQGIKARRTRNEGRVRALESLRAQYKERRNRIGQAELRLTQADNSGKLVFEAEHVDCQLGDTCVIRDFNTKVQRGDKIALIGPNGVGKSTLLKLLTGELTPTAGHIRRGTKLEVAYFDQQRIQLDPTLTVMDSVGEGKLTITVDGRTEHVAGYLQRFLFPAERLRSPVSMLSGGERNRLLLARLFAQPANLLVLDEPTNDLDAETLELLEDVLVAYSGTLLLVSHDRSFVDNVVTSTWIFEGNGRISEFVGGYSDWRREHGNSRPPKHNNLDLVPSTSAKKTTAKKTLTNKKPVENHPIARKLSYKEQRERETLPAHIEALEKEQTSLLTKLADPLFYQQEHQTISMTNERLARIDQDLAQAYARWQALES